MRGESVRVHPAPAGEPASEDYAVAVDGRDVFVHRARVSAVPFNQLWPGYQRPLDQTELAAFAYWDMAAPVEVEVVPRRPPGEVALRPRSLGIAPRVEAGRIRFTLERPAHVTVEADGRHRALHLFADPPEGPRPDPADPDVLYFPPGVHDVGRIEPTSGQTVYLAAGSVVHGAIEARSARGLRILGRGILDGSRLARTHRWDRDVSDPEPFGTVALLGCEDVEINGILIRDPNVYNVTLAGCARARVAGVKVVGSWRYNSDGIDLLNSRDVVIERCFVRSFDDSIVLTGWPSLKAFPCGHLPCRNVTVRDCVVWNDWGRALEIGAACSAPEISDVVFRNCDILRATHVALDVQNDGRALVQRIRFEDIRVEMDGEAPAPRLQKERGEVYRDESDGRYGPSLCVAEIKRSIWTRDREPGRVRDVVFRNITAAGRAAPRSRLSGFDAEHLVEDVTFEGLVIDGRPAADAASAHLAIGEHVRGVRFTGPGSGGAGR